MTTTIDIRPRPALHRTDADIRQLRLPDAHTPPLIEDGPGREQHAHCVRFVRALLEVCNGQRPVLQLTSWVTADVYDQVVRRLTIGIRRRSTTPTSRIASVHVASPHAEALEIAARIDDGRRSRALALRLDLRADRHGRAVWKCTAMVWG